MKKKTRWILIGLLSAVFLVSVGMLGYEALQYRQGEETYAEAEELAEVPDLSDVSLPAADSSAETESGGTAYVDPYAELLRNMDFAALREVNSDIRGWILIPNTVISYPILKTDNNQYYLKHTYSKSSSVVGAIFMECQNDPDFSDFNTIIYGHNMNNGSMFGSLKKYKSKSYWAAHPNVYVTDDTGCHCYQIFAAYEVSTQGETYQLGFSSTAARQEFLNACTALSIIDTGVAPTASDYILTLSTCTGRGHATRWVIQAVLKSTAAADAPAEEEPTEPTEEPTQPTSGESAASSSAALPTASSAASESAETGAASAPESETQAEGETQTQAQTETEP